MDGALKLGLPSKGRLLAQTVDWFAARGVDIATSERPYRIKLRFINPYAYRAAQLVAEFDAAVRTILTARHVGLISEEQSYRQIESCSAVLRSLFAIPQSYRALRVDRAAVKAGAPAAISAGEIMGQVPAAILLGEQRPRLAPRKARA